MAAADDGGGVPVGLERLPHVDLLFADIVMPDRMTGLGLAEQAAPANRA